MSVARRLPEVLAPALLVLATALLGFAVSGIPASDGASAEQLVLPFSTLADPAAVDAAVDNVRRRYGKSALTRGVLVGRDAGLEMPHLPD